MSDLRTIMNPTEPAPLKNQNQSEPYILKGATGKEMLGHLLMEIGIVQPKFRVANEKGAAAEDGAFIFSLTKHEKDCVLGDLYKIRIQQLRNDQSLSNLFFWSVNKDFNLGAFRKSYQAMARIADVIPIHNPLI